MTKPITKKLAPSAITADPRAQARATMQESVVADYAELLASGVAMPPLIAFDDGEKVWLADGFHRHAAAIEAGLVEIAVEVRPGTLRDAILHAAGANAAHGLRRTHADKRAAVSMLLADDEWARWADREIARRCGVHHELVGRLRAEASGGNRQMDIRTVERSGTVYEQRLPQRRQPADVEPLGVPRTMAAVSALMPELSEAEKAKIDAEHDPYAGVEEMIDPRNRVLAFVNHLRHMEVLNIKPEMVRDYLMDGNIKKIRDKNKQMVEGVYLALSEVWELLDREETAERRRPQNGAVL